MNHSETVNLIWNIANLIRDTFRRSKYPDVILPFTVLRRIDAVLAPTKEEVLARYQQYKGQIAADALDRQLRRASGFAFYNTSLYDFDRLHQDPRHLADNLRNYINGFSPNMKEVIERFDFYNTITKLDESDLLFLVLAQFRTADLHPDQVSNHQMGTIFEELIRKFNEAVNENPGEHFTPRDVVELMADLLLAPDQSFIGQPHLTITVADPCCGTGGMLTIAKSKIEARNPSADVHLFGQEVNPETYAIARSDLYLKSSDGRDAENIKFGSSLSQDQHSDKRFHYQLANPPYGKDWRMDAKAIQAEAARGDKGRFGAGTPRSSDGQLLFLQHMLNRMDPQHARVAIVMNGSPLFTGDAGSGESEIRRWILEHDWLEAIIALPEQLFYNTGIGTYIWILSNDKPAARTGQVQLINATGLWTPMRKSLGDKRRFINEAQRAEIIRLYRTFATQRHGDAERMAASQIFANTDFGYRKICVERPLRLNFQAGPERIERLWQERNFQKIADSRKRDPAKKAAEIEAGQQKQQAIIEMLRQMPNDLFGDKAQFRKLLNKAAKTAGLQLYATERRAILDALSQKDTEAPPVMGKDGLPEADSDLRDYERVPLAETVDDFFAREVQPYVPDAWVSQSYTDEKDNGVGRVGYELNFNRYFYEYSPPRPLAEIEADIQAREQRILALLAQITGNGGES
jgi:type I restriction enzyme M protein